MKIREHITGHHFPAFIAYVLLTLIFTYPVAFSGDIPGDGFDGYAFLWFFWWFKIAFSNLAAPYFTTYIFYPAGINLAFSSLTPFNSILSVPLQSVLGLVSAYKILWLGSFIFSGYGTYLLVDYLTANKKAAFVSGLIFMFSPYHFAHALGHMNLTTIEWIPFYVLFLFKLVRENNNRNAVFAGSFLFLTALSEYYYLVYLLFFTLIFVLYHMLFNKKDLSGKMFLKRLLIMAVTFVLLFSPFAYPVFKELLESRSGYMYTDSRYFLFYSADLLAFFIPSQFHPVFKEYVSPFYANLTGGWAEYTVFAGYTVLFLSIFACIRIRREEIRFWALSAVMFFILSLGTTLHINGVLYDVIPLPYSILMRIPVISIARVPSRWDVLIMLSLAVLAGHGLDHILKRSERTFFNKVNEKHVLPVLFSALVLFEFLAVPYPMSSSKVPGFYYDLKDDPEEYAILEVPASMNHVAHYMYYQTVHGKKLVNGYASRVPLEKEAFIRMTPFITQLALPSDNTVIDRNVTGIGQSVLSYYNIKYVILHENYMKPGHFIFANELLKNISKNEPGIYKEDGMVVYRVEKIQPEAFMLIQENWVSYSVWKGLGLVWISNDATILVYTPEIRQHNLSFSVTSFNEPRTLQIYLNDKPVGEMAVGQHLTNVELPIRLEKGENIIKFHTPEDCRRPVDYPGMDSDSAGCISLGFNSISLK